MKKLHFSIKIDAPKEKVWAVMLDDKTYREWTSPFGEGGYYEGSWDEGSDIKFLSTEEDGTLSGMISRIKENRPYEFLSIEHVGVMDHDVEDTTSDKTKEWEGALENYTFMEENGTTEVLVDLDTVEEYAQMFEEMWPKALQKLKEIAEK